MSRRLLLPTLAVAAVVAIVLVEVLTSGSGGTAGKPAPELPTAVLQPPKVTLADLRGAPALINFWASWCDPCRHEAPELERLSRSLPGGSHLVGVDYTDQEDSARAFIRSYHWTFPILSDPDGIYGARYGFSGLPATVAIDARGRIVQTLRGPQTISDFREALAAAGRD
ncbi:MAG TPA: TlpA disulfide reductase family protein [Solirubrobacterales bacterium]|jgi:cytochrome c biogenesis protein CcmG/thiol:disulfide interchange protein DsbE|nr:TlpA disulfide reductase family protein [Solirubrobacterales bacterium]